MAFSPLALIFLGTGLAVSVARALWQADAAMSVVCGLAIPYFMFTRQQHSTERMTAVWLIPVVAAEVAAAELAAAELVLVVVFALDEQPAITRTPAAKILTSAVVLRLTMRFRLNFTPQKIRPTTQGLGGVKRTGRK